MTKKSNQRTVYILTAIRAESEDSKPEPEEPKPMTMAQEIVRENYVRENSRRAGSWPENWILQKWHKMVKAKLSASPGGLLTSKRDRLRKNEINQEKTISTPKM
jgi:hypothetical protein